MADEPKKCKKEGGGAPAWMCTFADMMSLLLCFFVLILSFSSLDQPSFQKVAGSLRDAFGIQKKFIVWELPKAERMVAPQFEAIPFNVKREIEEVFEEQIAAGIVEVEEDAQAITLRIRDKVAFDSGRATIRPEFRKLLDRLGKVLVDADAEITVRGHTDNVPLKPDAPFKTNWGLSAARAVEVVEYLAGRFRIPSQRLKVEAYADGRPVASNNTEEGRAANRRVEFRIKPNKGGEAFQGIRELVEEPK